VVAGTEAARLYQVLKGALEEPTAERKEPRSEQTRSLWDTKRNADVGAGTQQYHEEPPSEKIGSSAGKKKGMIKEKRKNDRGENSIYGRNDFFSKATGWRARHHNGPINLGLKLR